MNDGRQPDQPERALRAVPEPLDPDNENAAYSPWVIIAIGCGGFAVALLAALIVGLWHP
jgi:hypothetical protein